MAFRDFRETGPQHLELVPVGLKNDVNSMRSINIAPLPS